MFLLMFLLLIHGTEQDRSPTLLKAGNLHSKSHIRNSDEDVSADLVLSITLMMKRLQWKRVVLIFDKKEYRIMQELLLQQDHEVQPASFLLQELDQELMSGSAFKIFLQSVHQKLFPKMNFILLTDFETSNTLLTMVDVADEEMNRTTDFRHYSFWIQACTSVCQPPSGPHPGIQHLENVILLSPSQSYVLLSWHLTTVPSGRQFSPSSTPVEYQTPAELFPNTKYGLNNRVLTISTLSRVSIFSANTSNGYQGYCMDVVKSLAHALNFSYVVIEPPDRQYGAEINGTWNGLVGQLARREADFAISTLTIHEEREKVMDFLYPPFFMRVDDLAYRMPSSDGIRWTIYLENFSPQVLSVLLASLVALTVFIYLLMKLSGNIEKTSSDSGVLYHHIQSFSYLFLYAIGSTIHQGVTLQVRRASTGVLVATWGFFSIVFAAAYSANLVATFAVNKQTPPFTNLAELVKQREYKWGLLSGTIRERIFSSSTAGNLKLAWEGMLEFSKTDPEVLSRDRSVHFDKVKREKYGYFASRYLLYALKEEDCNIRIMGEDLILQYYGVGVPTGHPLSRALEEKLSMIADSGLLDVWWKRWGVTDPEKCVQENTISALSLLDVASAFFLLCGGLGLSIFVLLIEKNASLCQRFT